MSQIPAEKSLLEAKMNRFILALFWFVLAVETDSIQNVVQKTESGVVSEMSTSIEESHAEGSSMHAVEKHGDVELETSLAAKGTPRRRRRDTPSPTVAPTPMPTAAPTVPPTAAPTPAPTEAPTVKAGKGKGGSLLEEEDYDEDVSESTPEECKAYFDMVDAHLKSTAKLEGDDLSGDPLLIFCNGQAFEMDPSAGVTVMTGLNNANEEDSALTVFTNQKIGLTMSAPLV